MQSEPITTNVVSLNPAHCEVYSVQHCVIKFVSDLWKVSGFLRFKRGRVGLGLWCYTTFNNISVISWWSVLLVEETGVPVENH
jgi:hypothetical protein